MAACELCHFYGMSINEVRELDNDDFVMMHRGMTMIQARKNLSMLNVVSYPHLSQSRERKKIHKELHKTGYPQLHERKIVTTKDLELI